MTHDAVAATADRYLEASFARESDRRGDVADTQAARDQGRAMVDHEIPDLTCGVITV
jgi:hypothetical protein